MVYFKHKQSGQIVSLEYLKGLESDNNYPILIHFPDKCDWNTEIVGSPHTYEYRVREIPFHEDFEILESNLGSKVSDTSIRKIIKILLIHSKEASVLEKDIFTIIEELESYLCDKKYFEYECERNGMY